MVDAEFLGYETLIRFQLITPFTTALDTAGQTFFTARIFQQLHCAVDEKITLDVDPGGACFFDQSGAAV
ncbi:hypothetical protein [Candidatus Electrothrix sp.]|uniref:hypothetical protein n=1 Tax=Candidatus Electrothrix sp. TaxID=2170559 RepID=UPI004056A0DF